MHKIFFESIRGPVTWLCDRDDINSEFTPPCANARCRFDTRSGSHPRNHKRNVKPRTQREKINAIPKTGYARGGSLRLLPRAPTRARGACFVLASWRSWDWVDGNCSARI